MRINNNIMAVNTHRQLGINNANGAKSIEKLSSGFRINRAGDDAAGLAISEKMRSQIRGLTQASRNSQDNISMIQTTEGALSETHAIIHRMRELAVQSSNDSNTDADREALQNEMNQLAGEVTRIANDTEFNTRKLLNGNLDNTTPNATGNLTFHMGANTDQNMKFGVRAMDAYSLGLAVNGGKINGGQPDVTGVKVNPDKTLRGKGVVDGAEVTISSVEKTAPVAAKKSAKELGNAATTVDFSAFTNGVLKVTVDDKVTTITTEELKALGQANKYTANDLVALINNKVGQDIASLSGGKISISSMKAGATANVSIEASGAADKDNLKTAFGLTQDKEVGTGQADYVAGSYDVTFTTTIGGTKIEETIAGVNGKAAAISGADADKFKGLTILTDGLFEGITGTVTLRTSSAAEFSGSGSVTAAKAGIAIDITTQKAANVAINRIDKALKLVSDQRAELGAVQNRLEHTIKNVDTAAENLQASESRIRDVDMAKEMMNFTKNNILQQAAQAMLAQANQAPQGILQLLR